MFVGKINFEQKYRFSLSITVRIQFVAALYINSIELCKLMTKKYKNDQNFLCN